MSDLIDRQKAIEALGEKPVGETDWDLGCRNQWEWDTEILRTIPSAEPERKKGKWIDVTEIIGFPESKCSVCQLKSGNFWMNFCPNCGADMKAVENE